MTNEEAIKVLNSYCGERYLADTRLQKAFCIAIRALKQEPKSQGNVVEPTKIKAIQELVNESFQKGFMHGKEEGIREAKQEPCEDAISRQAVDELSKELVHTTRDKADFLCNFWEGLQQLPSVNPQKWIPVSERLPEKDGDYLVCYEQGYREDYNLSEIGIAEFEVDCESFGYWYEHFDHHTLGSLGSEWEEIKVTAWMPLPKPYEPQEISDRNLKLWHDIYAEEKRREGD